MMPAEDSIPTLSVALTRWTRGVRSGVTWAMGLAVAGAATAAEPNLDVFKREIQPVLEKYCYDCHGAGVAKGGVTLDEFTTPAALADHALWGRALRNVRSGIMPPADELKLPAAEAEKLMQWIKRDAFGIDPAKPDPGRVTVRRLNRTEYRNTIRHLTGVEFDTLKEFPADDTGHGFDNIADVLTISPMLLEKYLDAAQSIVGKAVVTQPRTVATKSVLGRNFVTVKVDTTLPTPPTSAVADTIAAVTSPTPASDPAAAPASPANTPPVAPIPTPAASADPAAAPVAATPTPPFAAGAIVAGQTPPVPGAPVPGRGFGRGGRGGRGGPPPVTRPTPTIEGDTLILSYYTPAVVAAKHTITQAGKYQLGIDLTAHETYADNLFDLNKCRVVVTLDGEKLVDEEFVREGYSKKFDFVLERELTVGEHEIAVEIKPIGPDAPQYRRLRLRVNAVHFRGPQAPEFWVMTPGYDKYFSKPVPAGVAERKAYAREVLGKFATRAFRAPVPATTLDGIVNLAERIYAQPTSSFEAGVAQAMVAVLASPSFIFREERTEPLAKGQAHPQVDDYALASRLSYFFWSSMPDEELFKLAAAKTLRANLAAQMKRMLADPRSQEFVRNFTGQWLQARDIATVPITTEDVYLRDNPDPAYEEARETLRRIQAIPQGSRTAEDTAAIGKARGLTFEFARRPKPELNDRLRAAMLRETEMTFEHIVKEDRSLLELLESDYTFLNEELAKHYGVEGVTGADIKKVTLPAGSPRGGILTQGTILAVTSNPTRTSPVKRGVFILDAILGTPPAPPPPNIPSLEDAASPSELKAMSLRETLALHARNPTCNSCHSRMDPLGLALENFNAMGMWRTQEVGQPVETSGKLITGEAFKDIRDLKHILATSHRRDFYYCVSEKLLTYALGRGVEHYDTDTLDRLVAALEASGGKPSALLHGIVNSVPFQQRRQTPAALASDHLHPGTGSERLSSTHP